MTTPTSTRTSAATASTRAGGTAPVRARTGDLAFDGSTRPRETLPCPAERLGAALSACILETVERSSRVLPFRSESASLEVTANREEPPPRILRMHFQPRLVTDEAPVRLDPLHGSPPEFGANTNTLPVSCELTGELEAVSPEGATWMRPATTRTDLP